ERPSVTSLQIGQRQGALQLISLRLAGEHDALESSRPTRKNGARMARKMTRVTVFGLRYSRRAHERSGPADPIADEPFPSPLRALQRALYRETLSKEIGSDLLLHKLFSTFSTTARRLRRISRSWSRGSLSWVLGSSSWRGR